MIPPTRILGLDFGEKRVGVSISDPLRITAQPLHTIQYSTEKKLWVEIDRLWEQYEIETIVIGLPLNMNGSFGPSAEKAKLFAEKIKSRFDTRVELWDERLSSIAAEKTLQQFGRQPSKQKQQIDKLAAVLILQGYLDRRNFAKKEDHDI